MSDAGVTAAVGTLTGVISIPVLAAMGIDPSAMGAGLLGCVVVQTFIPKDGQTVRSIAILTLGSVVFASLVAPVFTPWVQIKLGEMFPKVPFPNDGVRAMTAGFLGAFAQPLVMLAKVWVFDRLRRALFPANGASDA